MINYLIELSIIHMSLVVAYWCFLRKEKQYAKMRWYLLGTTLLALFTPLIKLPKLFLSSPAPMQAIIIEAIPIGATAVDTPTDISSWSIDLLVYGYLIVSACFLLRFMGSVFYLIFLERSSRYEQFNGYNIRRIGNIKGGSFTFFNWIFLSENIDKSQTDYQVILKHEEAHVTMGHSYDMIFFELFKVFFWWLPSAWYINKEIKKIHEFQADAYALKSYHFDLYSSILISSILKSNGLSLASSFHDGLILKRIKKMKQQAKKVSPWKLGTLSILCAMLFVVFACSEDRMAEANLDTLAEKAKKEVFTLVEEQPEFEGGMEAFYKYAASEIRYPIEARQNGVEGQVDVQFVVEKDGSLSTVKAINGIGSGCDEEAVRVVQNASKFRPGSQRGKKLRVQMEIPIIFKLNRAKTNPDNSTQGTVVIGEVEANNGQLKVNANYEKGEWSGTLYSPEGDQLPGGNIIVAGTTAGTVSDRDGTFKIKADKDQELHISFVGYESVKLSPNTTAK